MKKLIILVSAGFLVSGCTTSKPSGEATAPKSEREYAERSEYLAQELHNTGQASSLQAARLQAAAATNQEWAAAVNATEQKQNQETFEQELEKASKGSK